jgi:VanZ family protein
LNAIRSGLRRAWQAAIVLLVAVIVAGGLLPTPGLTAAPGFDKLEHFVAYFVLVLLGSGIVPPERLRVVAARAFALGLVIEALQGLVTTTRTADWADVLANGAGVLVAWFIAAGGRAGWARRVDDWLARRGRS